MSDEDADNEAPKRPPYSVAITSDGDPVSNGLKVFAKAVTCVVVVIIIVAVCALTLVTWIPIIK